MKKIIIDKELEQAIILDYSNGKSINELSKIYSIPRARISQLLKDNNIPKRSLAETTILLQQKGKLTVQAKYGVDNVFQVPEVKEKIKQTNLDKYGVEYCSQAEETKLKVKQTLLKNFGVTSPLQSEEIKQKIREHCIETWNSTWTSNNPEVQKKIKATKLKKYNNENYNNFEQAKQTNLEKYGAEFYILTEECKKISHSDEANKKRQIASIQTNLKKYGVKFYAQTEDFHKKARKFYTYDGEFFDSLPELAVYIWAKDTGKVVIRNPIKLEYIFQDQVHYYFPDFSLDGVLIEIKGEHFFNKDGTMCNPFDHTQDALYEAKHQCGLANNVKFWRQADYQLAIDYFNFYYYIKDREVLKFERN